MTISEKAEQLPVIIQHYRQLLEEEPHQTLMLDSITSGGGGEWLPQCLLQRAMADRWGDEYFVRKEYGMRGNQRQSRLDIACINRTTRAVDIAVEIKAPWTNHDGIHHKLKSNGGMRKDLTTLQQYAANGAELCVELISIVELFMKGPDGKDLYAGDPGMSVGRFEKLSVEYWEMKYPTRFDYRPQAAQAAIDEHDIMRHFDPVSDWRHTRCGENEFGRVGIWDRFYVLRSQ